MNNKIVRIFKNWNYPDLLRQTPGKKGVWKNCTFHIDEGGLCDYTVILNRPSTDTRVVCSPSNIWALIQEPPIYERMKLQLAPNYVNKCYCQEPLLKGKKYVHSFPALPWHVDLDFDTLIKIKKPKKTKVISAIISNKSSTKNHNKRLYFIKKIKASLPELDHFGKGINPINNKWDGLAAYKYSIAIENFSNAWYWSEKIADCFLSWTIPFYAGNSDIGRYFPDGAFILLDLNNPYNSLEIIKEAIRNNHWEKNLAKLQEARYLILNKYNIFEFLYSEIMKSQETKTKPREFILRKDPKISRLKYYHYKCLKIIHDTL